MTPSVGAVSDDLRARVAPPPYPRTREPIPRDPRGGRHGRARSSGPDHGQERGQKPPSAPERGADDDAMAPRIRPDECARPARARLDRLADRSGPTSRAERRQRSSSACPAPRSVRTRPRPRARHDRRPRTRRHPWLGRRPALRARDQRAGAHRRGPCLGAATSLASRRQRPRRRRSSSSASRRCRGVAPTGNQTVPPETAWLLAAALTPVLIARRVLQHTVVTDPDHHGLGRCLPADRRDLCLPLPDPRRVHRRPRSSVRTCRRRRTCTSASSRSRRSASVTSRQ